MVDPASQDLAEAVDGWTGGAGADLVFEVSGHPAGAKVMTELARVRGTICLVGVHAETASGGPAAVFFGGNCI